MSVTRIREIPAVSYTWQDHASCTGLATEVFLGLDEKRPRDRVRRQALAVRICHQCPVRGECLAHALGVPEHHGVWGGTTPRAAVGDARRNHARPGQPRLITRYRVHRDQPPESARSGTSPTALVPRAAPGGTDGCKVSTSSSAPIRGAPVTCDTGSQHSAGLPEPMTTADVLAVLQSDRAST